MSCRGNKSCCLLCGLPCVGCLAMLLMALHVARLQRAAGDPVPRLLPPAGVFGPAAGQEEVYAAVGAQMVDNCMAGGAPRSCPPWRWAAGSAC